MVLIPPTMPARQLLAQAFGPGDWRNRAANTLGVHYDHIRHIGNGNRSLTRHHYRKIANYCDQRHRARKQVAERECAKLARVYEEAAKGWAAAGHTARAKEIELIRQGRK